MKANRCSFHLHKRSGLEMTLVNCLRSHSFNFPFVRMTRYMHQKLARLRLQLKSLAKICLQKGETHSPILVGWRLKAVSLGPHPPDRDHAFHSDPGRLGPRCRQSVESRPSPSPCTLVGKAGSRSPIIQSADKKAVQSSNPSQVPSPISRSGPIRGPARPNPRASN
jgi:hypothetical protein